MGGALILAVAAVLAIGKIALNTQHNTQRIGTAATLATQVAKHVSQQQMLLRLSQLRGCHRLNVERALNNRNWVASYRADKSILHYDLTFKRLVIAGLKHQTSEVKRTPEQEEATTLFVAKLESEIDGLRNSMADLDWVPLTNCSQATDHPGTYAPPEPVLFSDRLPPRRALTVGRGG